MSLRLSRYLRLRINSNLTADAKYNLERIDSLGATFISDSANQLNIRSESAVVIEPNSPDLGGSGSGGSVSIGTSSHEIDSLNIYASAVNLSQPLGLVDKATGGTKYLRTRYKSDLSGSVDNAADRTLSIDPNGADRSLILGGNLSLAGDLSTVGGNLTLTLPGNLALSIPANSVGYLSNNGSGTLSWTPLSGAGDVLGATATWVTADGSTKVVTHILSSTNVDVSVYDEGNDLIWMDSISIDSSSQITLISSEAPTTSWKIVLQAKP